MFHQKNIILNSIGKHAPLIKKNCEKAWFYRKESRNNILLEKKYLIAVPKESIDHSIMEKEKSVAIVKANIGWQDVGSWDALQNILSKLKIDGDRKHFMLNSENNFILCDDLIITTIGIKDLIIVKKDNKLLLLKKGSSHLMQKILKKMK